MSSNSRRDSQGTSSQPSRTEGLELGHEVVSHGANGTIRHQFVGKHQHTATGGATVRNDGHGSYIEPGMQYTV